MHAVLPPLAALLLVPLLSLPAQDAAQEPAQQAQEESTRKPDPVSLTPRQFDVLTAPLAREGARFGSAVAAVDAAVGGEALLLVGAEGAGAAYLFREASWADTWNLDRVVDSTGPARFDRAISDDAYGRDVALADLQGDAAVELVVGAPLAGTGEQPTGAVHVQGLDAQEPFELTLTPEAPGTRQFGHALATGDLNGDGRVDLVVGAPTSEVDGLEAGRVFLFFGPLGEGPVVVLDNPAPTAGGGFGLAVAVARPEGRVAADLYVSAPGNAAGEHPGAGLVYSWRGEFDAERFDAIGDPAPVSGSGSRFGQALIARDSWLAIGSPLRPLHLPRAGEERPETVLEAGAAFAWESGAGKHGAALVHPLPQRADHLGGALVLGDFLGSGTLDVGVGLASALPANHNSPLALLLWPAGDADATPRLLRALPDAGSDWLQAACSVRPRGLGRDLLVSGDPSWSKPAPRAASDLGRVVVYLLPDVVELERSRDPQEF